MKKRSAQFFSVPRDSEAYVVQELEGKWWSVKPKHRNHRLLGLVEAFEGNLDDIRDADGSRAVVRLLTLLAVDPDSLVVPGSGSDGPSRTAKTATRVVRRLNAYYLRLASHYLICRVPGRKTVVIAVDRASDKGGWVVLLNALRENGVSVSVWDGPSAGYSGYKTAPESSDSSGSSVQTIQGGGFETSRRRH